MDLSRLKSPAGARKRRKRVGRGVGSGHGKTATKGHKGQKARSGKKLSIQFEGGQTSLARRLPKVGFANVQKKVVAAVNLRDLNRFDSGATVDLALLKSKKLIKGGFTGPYKILAQGNLEKSLTVKAHAFSKKAQTLIEQAGGKTEVIK